MQMWFSMKTFIELWYPEMSSIIVTLHTLVSLGSISFNIIPLCTCLISAWLSLVGSRHHCNVLLGLGTMMKLLHGSAFHLLLVVLVFGVVSVFLVLS